MDREKMVQNAVYAAAEARQFDFGNRLRKRSDQCFVKRVGKASAGEIFRLLFNVPTAIKRDGRELKLMGGGFESLVYADSSVVSKINIRTLTTDKSKAEAEAAKDQQEFDLCKPFLGSHWPDTSYGTTDFMGRYAVEARQPFIAATNRFSSIKDMLEYRDDPQYVQQLESLFVAVGNLYQSTGYYPDLLGANNLALAESIFGDPSIVILDTGVASAEHQETAVPNEDIKIGIAISEQMRLWETALTASKELPESHGLALH